MSRDIFFEANKVILSRLGNVTHFFEPVRCNHLVIVLCCSGEACVEINYTVYELKQNGLLFVKPLDIVKLVDGSDDFNCIVLMLPVDSHSSILQDFDISNISYINKRPIVYYTGDYMLFVKQFFDILETANRNFDYDTFEKIAEKQVTSLFYMQRNHYSASPECNKNVLKEPRSRKKELFRGFIKDIIGSHTVSREVLFYANELGVSSGYLNEVCNIVSSHSAKEIIDSAVISRLKYELLYTTKSIQDITDEYNFPSQSYFCRYFKRLTGVTPTGFRRGRVRE